jgi:hypothetical protein
MNSHSIFISGAGKIRQILCRSYFRAQRRDSGKSEWIGSAIFASPTPLLMLLIVFTSFLLFFGALLWYASSQNKPLSETFPNKKTIGRRQW